MIEVTNAVNGQKALIFPNKIFGLSASDKLEATILISGEGGQFAVKETKEQILELIKKTKVTYTGGKE